jgi:polysaccharide biosynthesis transport protein
MESGQWQPDRNGNNNSSNSSKRPGQTLWQPQQPIQGDDDVVKLGDIFGTLGRHALLIALTTAGLATLGGLFGSKNPVYLASFQMLAKSTTVEKQVVGLQPQSLNAQQQAGDAVAGKAVDDTKLRLLFTDKVLQPVVDQLKSKYPSIQTGQLAKGLDIKPIPGTDILEVRYQGNDKVFVQDALNALGQAYVAYSLEEPKADVQQGKEFIDSQLPKLTDRVNQLQSQLQNFRQSNQFYEPESQNKEVSDQLNTFRKQQIENQVFLEQAIARYEEIQNANESLPGEGKVALVLSENVRYQDLLKQLSVLDTVIAEKSSIFQDDHEEVKVLRDQRAKLVPYLESEARRVQAEAESKVRDLSARNDSLLEKEDQLAGRVQGLGGLARQYTDIQRELLLATDNLNKLRSTRSTLDLNAAQRQTPWRVVSKVSDPKLTSFDQNILLGGLAGLLLGSAIALTAERLRNVFHHPDDFKKAYKLPVLGVLPHNKELGQVQPLSLSQAAFASNRGRKLGMLPFLEAIRSLQTNIRLLNADAPVRSIVISSATPQDGKSTIAAYLAQVAASMGNRVLLVDAEMRRPQIHTRMGIPNTRGLSDLLVSNALPQEYIVQASDNVSVLTAGQLPPDPIGLLSSQRMHQLMAQFATEYDFVIYDTPPLGGFADAHLVASKTDGLLLVTRIGRTNRELLNQVTEGLRMLPTKVLGLVINDSQQPLNQGIYASYYNFQDATKSPASVQKTAIR